MSDNTTPAPNKPADPNSLISTPEEDKAGPVDRLEVLPDEVRAYAKSRCPSCWGKGIFIVSRPLMVDSSLVEKRFSPVDGTEITGGLPPTGHKVSIPGPPEEALCHCALKKFIRANIEKIDIDFGTAATGKLWWRVPVVKAKEEGE